METLAALGLASNIVQFVHFGASLLSEASDRYHSLTGATVGHAELGDIARNLAELALKLQTSSAAAHSDIRLLDICKRCSAVADELLSVLEGLRVAGKRRRWESFKQAIRSVCNEKKIDDFKSRINDLQNALLLCLVGAMRDEQSQIHVALDRLREQHECMEISGHKTLHLLKAQFIRALEDAREKSSQNAAQLLTGYQSELSLLLRGSEHAAATQAVIQSLKYDQMTARQQAIEEAHKRSFEWIFDSSGGQQRKHHFLQWLESGDGLFWVAGRAGSGKSTLMKYIVEHPKTETVIRRWAGDRDLVTASHFFWIAGNDMQKSQEGLLLSLLDDIFTRCPELIPLVTPSRWEKAMAQTLHRGQWNRKELIQAFNLLKQQNQIPVRFCFFIDGLDEYNGDHGEIAQILQDLSASKHIKVCVSSRPWNIFEKTIGVHNSGELYLEDLTCNDIRIYVRETLALDSRFMELEDDTGGAIKTQIVEDIVTQAHGVFLWVVLVVRDLRRGLSNDDTGALLLKRLATIPPTLEGFFQMMLDRIDLVYREQTAQIILMVLRTREPLPLMMFAFLDKYRAASVCESPIVPKNEQELRDLFIKTRMRVKARCCDLLEVPSGSPVTFADPAAIFLPTSETVNFIHRTARDFVLTLNVQTQLRNYLTIPFEPQLHFCESLLLQLKIVKFRDAAEQSGILISVLDEVIGYALSLEQAGPLIDLALLDEFERVLSHHRSKDQLYLSARTGVYHRGITPGSGAIIHERFIYAPRGTNVFQAAIQFGLHRYVERRLLKMPSLVCGFEDFIPLQTALVYSLGRSHYRGPPPDLKMVKLLLKHGASPCQPVPKLGKTVLCSVMDAVVWYRIPKDEIQNVEEAFALLLRAVPSGDPDVLAALRPGGSLARGINHEPTMRRLRGVARGTRRSEWIVDWVTACLSCCWPRVKRRRWPTESETRPLLSPGG